MFLLWGAGLIATLVSDSLRPINGDLLKLYMSLLGLNALPLSLSVLVLRPLDFFEDTRLASKTLKLSLKGLVIAWSVLGIKDA